MLQLQYTNCSHLLFVLGKLTVPTRVNKRKYDVPPLLLRQRNQLSLIKDKEEEKKKKKKKKLPAGITMTRAIKQLTTTYVMYSASSNSYVM